MDRSSKAAGLTRLNSRPARAERKPSWSPPKDVWTNYKEDLDDYHGALEQKEDYTKAFLKQTPEAIASGAYDARKIRIALDALVAECSSIATQGGLAAL
jgi:hypothetical protein